MVDTKVSFFVITILFAIHHSDAVVTFSAPTGISSDAVTLTVDEDLDVDGTVGTFTAADDASAGIEYTLAPGSDSGFDIDQASGVLTITSALNYESGTTSYTVTVVATDDADSTDTATVVVTINVQNVNESPTITPFDKAVFKADKTGAGAVIATVAATDPDAGDTLTFSISGGNTGNMFTVDGTEVKVATGKKLDASTQNYYTLTVRVKDAGELMDDTGLVVGVFKCPSSAISISANSLTTFLLILGAFIVRKTV
ncbi:hypothetical protein ACF0H5_023871 [Mactra antiquata]